MQKLFSLLVVIILFGFSMPAHLLAAVITIDSEFKALNEGDIFTVDVLVDTENQVVNAVETKIIFPSDVLEFVEASDGESVVSLWVQKPTYDGFSSVHFSGVTPGGFSGRAIQLLTLKFKTINEGQGIIYSDAIKFLLHDGLGTEAKISKQNLHITVNRGDSNIIVNSIDSEIPESFSPEIIQDTDVFDGGYALIFSTKDKSSGIDYYEVKEGWFGLYHKAESPYVLKDQSLTKKIQVRAIDKLGNERIEVIYPQNWQPLNQHPWVIISILVLCVLSILMLVKYLQRFAKK